MDVDKIDLSLDDIIKLNKKIKKQQNVRGRGRGRGQRRGGGATVRGRGNSSSRGGLVITNQSFKRQRGGGTPGIRRRRGVTTALRGGNRFNQAKKAGINPVTRQNVQTRGTQQTRGRGRGRGRGVRGRGIGVRGRGIGVRGRGIGVRGRGRLSAQGQLRGQDQGPQIGLTKGLTSLNRRREQAIKSLVKAKETLAKLNARQSEQKQSRTLEVNQRRGLQISTSSLNTVGRGRGRGRGGRGRGRGNLSRYSSNVSLTSIGSQSQRGARGRGRGRGGLNRTFSGSLVSVSGIGSQGNRQRRRWRQPKVDDSSLLTISVQNSPPPSPKKRNKLPRYNVSNMPDSNPDLQAQIRNLKPAVSIKYNFKKSVFSQGTTSTSLSDRFAASLPTSPGGTGTQTDLQGRKVFF